MDRRLFLVASAGVLALPGVRPALAAEHQVQMLNKGPNGERNWYEPSVTYAEPGDTIHFVAVDKLHNSESLVVPEGGETWKGQLSKDVSVTLTKPGVYAFKCAPHFGLGMVGLIVVGNSSDNLDEVKAARYPGLAKKRVEGLIEQVEKKLKS
ncbi:MAG: pseudoazurin [Geminicoccaceae bacterium]